MIKRVRAAILCDDVRVEISSKLLLIGVYGDRILTQMRPHTFNVFLVLMVELNAPEAGSCEVRITGGKVERILPLDYESDADLATLMMPFNIALVEPRMFNAEVRNLDGEWMEAGSWKFDFGPDAQEAPPEYAAHVQAIADSARAQAASEAEARG